MTTKFAGLAAIFMVGFVATAGFTAAHERFLNEEARDALASEDFEAFQEAIAHSPRANRHAEEHFAHMSERFQNQEQVRQAIENNDYDAWMSAIEERPRIADVVTEDNFELFAQMYQAREDGDYEQAKVFAEELGIKEFVRPMHGYGRGPPRMC